MVTDGDRHKAAMVIGVWKHTGDDLADIIAAQLADEREKARAPFLALADSLEDDGDHTSVMVSAAIRRAAEDVPVTRPDGMDA